MLCISRWLSLLGTNAVFNVFVSSKIRCEICKRCWRQMSFLYRMIGIYHAWDSWILIHVLQHIWTWWAWSSASGNWGWVTVTTVVVHQEHLTWKVFRGRSQFIIRKAQRRTYLNKFVQTKESSEKIQSRQKFEVLRSFSRISCRALKSFTKTTGVVHCAWHNCILHIHH